MDFSFTGIVYLPISFAIGFIAYRFLREWKDVRENQLLVYAIAFSLLALVCFSGVLAGSVLSDKQGIIWMLIVSNVLLTLSNAFFTHIFFSSAFPKISPWWGFAFVAVFGFYVTSVMVYSPINPVREASGGIYWGIPLRVGIFRSIVYLLGMAPLIWLHIHKLRLSSDETQIRNHIFLILFFSLTLLVVIFDFIIEPLSGLHALYSEVLILILSVVGMFIYFLLNERIIKKTERRFRRLVDNMPDLICLVGMEGKIQYTNKAYKEIMGYSQQELKDSIFLDLVYPQDRQNVQDKIFHRQEKLFEFRLIRSDDRIVWVESSGSFLLDEQANATQSNRLVITSRDITKRKALENHLRQSQKMEAVGLLAGGVAHDFNNLLTVINGYAELMLSKIDEGDPFSTYLKQIHDSGKRAAALTGQLLAFSRKQILEPKVLNLNDLLRSMEKMLRRLIREDIRLELKYDAGLKNILADRSQLEQVILNLVINARDAMPSGGVITIETHNVFLNDDYESEYDSAKVGEYVLLAVADTGLGMDTKTAKRIFEPFFTTKAQGKGTGLGLSTAYGIIKQSGGNILVYSEPGIGTVFKIYLPISNKEVQKKESNNTVKNYGGTEAILVVEDDEAVRRITEESLKELGYKVVCLEDGRQALQLVKKEKLKFDLLLTDVVMPNMSGRDLAKKISPLIPNIKVLYMSGYTDNAIVHHGILDDGLQFIQKPFTAKALARAIRLILSA